MSGGMNRLFGENPGQHITRQRNVTDDPPVICADHLEFRHRVTLNLSENSYHEITYDSKSNCSRPPPLLRDWNLDGVEGVQRRRRRRRRRRQRSDSPDRLRSSDTSLDSKPRRSNITTDSYINKCIRKADGALVHCDDPMPEGSSTLERVLRDLDGRRKESRDERTRTGRGRDISPPQTSAVCNP